MAFLEIQLDKNISYGAQGGPFYQTLVMSTPSRAETRLSQTSRHFRKWKLPLTDKSLVQMQALEQFIIATRGKMNGFRFLDKRDYTATNEPLTYTSGTTVQLIKTYNMYGVTEVRPIRKPQTGVVPLTLQRDGAAWISAGNWSLNTTTGIVTFTADQTGHVFTWSGQFDVPVRFDVDEMQATWEDFDVLSWDSVDILEIAV